MNVLRSHHLPPGAWVLLCPGTVACAEGLYEAAVAALAAGSGLRPEDAPPWLLEALAAADHASPPPPPPWTGPLPAEWADGGGWTLRTPVPAARWPFGPPEEHGPGCGLRSGGLFCDCCQSAAECGCHKR